MPYHVHLLSNMELPPGSDEESSIVVEDGVLTSDYRMKFLPEQWIQGKTYYTQQQLRNLSYITVANKTTLEYPFPIPVGPQIWASGFGDTPPWNTLQSPPATRLEYGQRYTYSTNGYVTQIRLWVDDIDPLITYEVLIVLNPELAQPNIDVLVPERSYDTLGWWIIEVQSAVILDGATFDVVVVKTNRSSFTDGTQNYDYVLAQNDNVTPLSGEITHSAQSRDHIKINKTSLDGDFSTELSVLSTGDQFSFNEVVWVITFKTDNGTYWEFDVTPAVRDIAQTSALFTFRTYAEVPMDYVNVSDHYLSSSVVEGFFSSTGTGNAVFDKDAYGIDVEVQEADLSDDWDIVAILQQKGGDAPSQRISSEARLWAEETSAPIGRYGPVFTTDNSWTELGRHTTTIDKASWATMIVTGKVTTSFAYFFGEYRIVIENNGGVLMTTLIDVAEFKPHVIYDVRVVEDGNDAVIEVHGKNGDDVTWNGLVFFKEIGD